MLVEEVHLLNQYATLPNYAASVLKLPMDGRRGTPFSHFSLYTIYTIVFTRTLSFDLFLMQKHRMPHFGT